MTTNAFVVAVDRREQTPFTFDAWPTAAATLAAGDYSIIGLEEHVAVERKTLSDLAACCGHDRERFKRELHRLGTYHCRAVVVEADLGDILAHSYRSKIKPACILGSIASWQTRYGVPFNLAGAHGSAITLAILRTYHRQLHDLLKTVSTSTARTP